MHDHHKVDYIELSATDIPATKAFYSAAFGWKFTDYGPDYVAFENSGTSGGFAKARRFHFLDPNDNELAVWSDK
jgi:predicted enzyme related to lactoylglutathione lyase